MIIRKDPSGALTLMGQTDHSRFVGQLAAHWGSRDFETPKPATSSPPTTRRRRTPLADASPVLAGLASPSVPGRVALGPRAGARVRRLGGEPALGHVTSRGPRQAQRDGFDLHANVCVPPNDRARLEQLGRYLVRPPLAQDRLQLRADGRVLVTLKTVWRDGTSPLLFEPIEFLECCTLSRRRTTRGGEA